MLSFTLSGNISMDNHQWRPSQAYTYEFHISIHISITLIPYHLIFLLHVNFFRYIFYVFGISFFYTFSVFLFLYFTYSYTYHVHFLSCSYTVHVSYTFISRILSYNLSYIVLYFYLHSYTFHIRYFCMLSSDTFHVLT